MFEDEKTYRIDPDRRVRAHPAATAFPWRRQGFVERPILPSRIGGTFDEREKTWPLKSV